MNTPSRTIRVFLSSTFRDFAEERDLLVRQIFPELRRRCRERQVELIDVDLRWGITKKQAQQGKVLPICLAEIDRARPYFMGFIGERYGWIPASDQYDPSILQEQPWLEEHRGGKSVTELEILHGVLNDPAMAGRAFFYFRDPKYSLAQGGVYLGESTEEEAKLNELKDRIRQSGFPVVEKYQNPAALAERVRADIWKLIDEAFPLEEVPDALAMERRRHEAYGASRLGMYLGGRKYFTKLDRAIHKTGGFKPVLITGESGGGKSALLANWMQAHAAAHPETLTFVHYLGAGADAADPLKLVTRLLREVSRVTGENLKLESEPQKIFDQLPEWLARASAHAQKNQTEWLLVLDGLDKLLSLRDLRWWPGFLPQSIKLVCSCLESEVRDAALKRMSWTELGVCPLGKANQAIFIKDFLAKYRKFLTRPQLASVQAHPLSGNPLFLKTLLEELRVFGVHEKLDSKITHYLNSQSIDDLFEKVLERVEQDAGKKPVRSAMEAIWASRAGLAQDELLAIAKLKPSAWATIHNALDEALIDTNGRITFGHDYLRKAVEDRYLFSKKSQNMAHTRLAEWFDKQEVNARIAEELPWQWQQAGEREGLKKSLISKAIFEALYKHDKYELLGYWLTLKENSPLEEYEEAWKEWSSSSGVEWDLAASAFHLAGFLQLLGNFGTFTESLYRLCLHIENVHFDGENPVTWLRLGCLLSDRGDYDGAEQIYRKALKECVISLGENNTDTLCCIHNLGNVLYDQGNYTESEVLYRRVLSKREDLLGRLHPDTLASVMSLGILFDRNGDFDRAENLYLRALNGYEKTLGVEHPDTLTCIGNLGSYFLDKADFAKSEYFCRKALDGRVKVLGQNHPDTLRSSYSLAELLCAKGKYDNAETLYSMILKESEKFLGPDHPFTFECTQGLGNLLSLKGDYDGAESLCRKTLNGFERVLGMEHPTTLGNVTNLGNLLGDRLDFDGAENLYRRALAGREKALGPKHPDTLNTVHNLATTLHDKGDLDAAETLYRRALVGLENAFGGQHPRTLLTLNNLGNLLRDRGDIGGAELLYRRAIEGYEASLGSGNPETLRCLANLGLLLRSKNEYDEALRYYRRVLDGWKSIYGHENIKTLSYTEDFAELLFSIGEYSEGSTILKGAANQEFGSISYNRACFECKLGNLSDAKLCIARHLRLHPDMRNSAYEDPDLFGIRGYIKQINLLKS